MGRACLALVVGALFLAVPATMAAQGIPLPQPAPKNRTQAARALAMPTDALGRPVPMRPGESVAYDGSQRALVDRVSTYLSSVQTLTGDFVQIGPDGGRTVGKFYLQKPGRVRFEYDAPSAIDVVADGSSVVVRDRRLANSGSVSAVANAAALPVGGSNRSDARHHRHRGVAGQQFRQRYH